MNEKFKEAVKNALVQNTTEIKEAGLSAAKFIIQYVNGYVWLADHEPFYVYGWVTSGNIIRLGDFELQPDFNTRIYTVDEFLDDDQPTEQNVTLISAKDAANRLDEKTIQRCIIQINDLINAAIEDEKDHVAIDLYSLDLTSTQYGALTSKLKDAGYLLVSSGSQLTLHF